ncbi:MAG: hypothetical protein K0R00_3863, partial [Herbinix sp.]|nr:hypothetical protein [Herbinix sp.]
MLKLKNIFKDYKAGDTTVKALKEINIEFRKNEFVSILGPSGCGKTTLLNIIGGLDRYTSGDLSIDGRSTKEFKDSDWDSYRNHSIGFVFQNYNLIPHQSVLSNVELAMTLSGVSKAERRQRAIDALTKVGLADQIKKKPTQMSGGQMQRVAIARALVNNPEILLADEPTGALDSETSVQIMEILKDISKERLIIMVTHNPDLAKEYSSRIIRLFDGNIVNDSNPYEVAEYTTAKPEHKKKSKAEKKASMGKTSMSFFTALSLSLNNLMTKKTRTFMTAFAGSIGIIGIALILSLSNGIQVYIDKVQEDTLSSYPINIESETIDMTSLLTSMSDNADRKDDHDLDKVYSNTIMFDMMNTMLAEIQTNNLEAFKQHLEDPENEISDHISAVQYGYNLDLNVYMPDTSKGVQQINPSELFDAMYGGGSSMNSPMSSMFGSGLEVWSELLGNQDLLNSQYDVISGRWPESYNEIILIVDQNNEISDMVMYSLGLKDPAEAEEIMAAAMKGETFETESTSYNYEDILAMTYKLVLPTDYYHQADETGAWKDMREDLAYMTNLLNQGLDLKVVGIVRPNEDAVSTSITGAIGYTHALTEYVINTTNEREIVKQQLANPETDVFTGIEFKTDTEEATVTMDDVTAYIATLDPASQAQMAEYMNTMTEEQILEMFSAQLAKADTDATYEGNLELLGIVDLDKPDTINIYAASFDEKEAISNGIEAYNKEMTDAGKDEFAINYTDLVGLMMSSVSSIINVISYVLIAFVGISLVVSSIMIGIITYISVLERTKEIGILRSIGASKKDISRVFNAETMIVGFVSGSLGIIVTVLL